jgi:hypothetical protein
MSTRNYDHCSCGHKREKHEDFKDGCSKCACEIFHRGMIHNSM